jgi:hypothetical protein
MFSLADVVWIGAVKCGPIREKISWIYVGETTLQYCAR